MAYTPSREKERETGNNNIGHAKHISSARQRHGVACLAAGFEVG